MLYERVVRFVEIFSPNLVLIENVPAIVRSKQNVVHRSLAHLRALGYTVDSDVVDLWRLGVPQWRSRHILVAAKGIDLKISRVISRYEIERARAIDWAISDIEDEPHDTDFTRPTDHSVENKVRIDYLFNRQLFDLPNHMRPKCHQNGHNYKSMYGRLRYDAPAQTITSGFGSPGQGRYVHPTKRRSLTPHEAARIQTIPDTHDFSACETRTGLAAMIGNAVPPKLSYAFVLEFLLKHAA